MFLELVQGFKQTLSEENVERMGKVYGFANSGNVEVVSRYLGVGLRARDRAVYEPTAELLGKVGRMKFVRPLYVFLTLPFNAPWHAKLWVLLIRISS